MRRLLKNNHVILLVDNLSILEPQEGNAEGRRDQKFLEWLNTFLNQKVQIITTLRPPIDKLFPHSEKPALYETLIMSINLDTFSEADARSFIKQRLADTGYSYQEFKDLVEAGKRKTPHQLRMECYDKFEKLSNN